MPRDHSTAAGEQLTLFDLGGVNMQQLRTARAHLEGNGRALNTKRAYATGWADFAAWCASAGREALPAAAETLALYVVHCLGEHKKISTVEQRMAAVVHEHRAAGLVPLQSEAREVLRGARREFGTAEDSKAALTVDHLRAIVRALPKDCIGVRDRALLVFGFASALRRSELVALNLEDVTLTAKGIRVRVGKSKTDQEGAGREIGIFPGRRKASCPVTALKMWLYVRGKKPGPLFVAVGPHAVRGVDLALERLTGAAVADALKRAVVLIGLDPHRYGAHSLRAGCVTAAAEAGVPESIIMQRTGHRCITTLARYVRPATVFSVDPLARAL
jgi:integrase